MIFQWWKYIIREYKVITLGGLAVIGEKTSHKWVLVTINYGDGFIEDNEFMLNIE